MPKVYFIGLCLVGGMLWLTSVAQDICVYGFACKDLDSILGYLDVEAERSLYTWYSTAILFVTGFMAIRRAAGIGAGMPYYGHWIAIGVLFSYLSVDEMLSIHEKLSTYGAMIVRPEGYFRYTWVVPAMGLVAVVFLALIRMVLALPSHERRLTFLSGAAYLGGAMGMEMLTGNIANTTGQHTLLYQLFNSLEEAMEVIGVLIFLAVLRSLEGRRSAAVPETFAAERSAGTLAPGMQMDRVS